VSQSTGDVRVHADEQIAHLLDVSRDGGLLAQEGHLSDNVPQRVSDRF
jgi:hypothetical protein